MYLKGLQEAQKRGFALIPCRILQLCVSYFVFNNQKNHNIHVTEYSSTKVCLNLPYVVHSHPTAGQALFPHKPQFLSPWNGTVR